MSSPSADQVLADAHRAFFGRLVGWVFRMSGDLQLAEDAVAAAFAAAVTAWRERGIPDAPEAWLRVAARNQARTLVSRRARTVSVPLDVLVDEPSDRMADAPFDDRLALMFVCAHPAIDPRLHAPLMLQAVLGVDAARIAGVYLVPPATMAQRLSRAKTKIRDAGIGFRLPEVDEFAFRLAPVLQAVYAAYGVGAPAADVADERGTALRAEALRLSAVLTETLPGHGEVWGLRALLLHAESRRPGRVVAGEFVPLPLQDTALWSAALRAEADDCLRWARRRGSIGRFQLEAAISAIHYAGADGVAVDPQDLLTLYEGLLRIAPSVGALVAAAAAHVAVGDLDRADQLLASVAPEAARDHQPYWVCRSELAAARGDVDDALRSLDRAIGLTQDPAVRRHLIGRRRPHPG